MDEITTIPAATGTPAPPLDRDHLRLGSTTHPSAISPGAAGVARRWFQAPWFQVAAALIGALGAITFWRRTRA